MEEVADQAVYEVWHAKRARIAAETLDTITATWDTADPGAGGWDADATGSGAWDTGDTGAGVWAAGDTVATSWDAARDAEEAARDAADGARYAAVEAARQAQEFEEAALRASEAKVRAAREELHKSCDREAHAILREARETRTAHWQAARDSINMLNEFIWGPAIEPDVPVINLVDGDPAIADAVTTPTAGADPLDADMDIDTSEFDRAQKTMRRCWRVRHCGFQCANQSSERCDTGLCRKHCLKQNLSCEYCQRNGGQNDRGPRHLRTRRPGPHYKWR